MIVAGGVYREECQVPTWSRIFGSGGRAAAAVSTLSPGSILYAYACRDWSSDLRFTMDSFGIKAHITEIDVDISFNYFHPLSAAILKPTRPPRFDSLRVAGEAVLRFGFIEGDAIVQADRVVYDPQNWTETFGFWDNGSKAGQLAIVLNEAQLHLSSGSTGPRAVRILMDRCGTSIVVVKRGPRGAVVYSNDDVRFIPAFKTNSVFKIGSGDIFSAVFSYLWAEKRLSPSEAAEGASRAVARYVESRNVQSDLNAGEPAAPIPPNGPIGSIYLAGPFFNLAQRWLIEEARSALFSLGAEVFSPFHDVGTTGGPEFIASADLEGLRNSKAVFAIVDGEDAGTLFEIGYARDRGIPVIALAESLRAESLTMLQGSGCHIFRDFSSALYHAVWATMQ
jgi:nucleoside 2-deoxyribosyltransferase